MQLKIRGSHLTCNVKKKHLNVRERVEVAEMNKDGPVSSPAVLWIVSVWKKILVQKKYILRERIAVVVEIEDMLRYNHLQ